MAISDKSDFVRDEEVIARERDNLITQLYKSLQLDPSTNYIESKKTLDNKEKLILNMPVALSDNIYNMGEWHYGPYYMEGANGRKTGFYKCINGKYLFVETESKISKAQNMVYKKPIDLSIALINSNPNLAGQIQLGADNVIQIIGSVHDIELPNTSLHYDQQMGKIVDSCNSNYAFDIEFVNAMNADLNGMDAAEANKPGSGNSTSSTRGAQASLQSYNDADETSKDDVVNSVDVDPIGTSVDEMKDAHDNYTMDKNGDVQRKEDDGAFRSIGNMNESKAADGQTQRQLALNEIWINSCCSALNINNTNNDEKDNGRFMDGEYGAILGIIRIELQKQNESMESIVTSVAQADGIENIALAAQIAYNYLQQLSEHGHIAIQNDMDVSKLAQIINIAENNKEMDDDNVMTMQRPGPNGAV